jgi:hypothetical protein
LPTQREIAAHLDLSVTKVAEYEKRGVIVRASSLDENRVAYIRHLRERKGGITDERARLDAARAKLAEQEFKKRSGDLVPATDQDRVVIALATSASARLQAIAARIAQALAAERDPARCRELVANAIDAALRELAEEGQRAAERLESEVA